MASKPGRSVEPSKPDRLGIVADGPTTCVNVSTSTVFAVTRRKRHYRWPFMRTVEAKRNFFRAPPDENARGVPRASAEPARAVSGQLDALGARYAIFARQDGRNPIGQPIGPYGASRRFW